MVHKLNSMILAAIVMIGLGSTAQAGVLLVAGSPGYDPDAQTGLKDGTMSVAPGWSVTNSGTAVGKSIKYDGGADMGSRAVRWDYTGTAAVELGYLGLRSDNYTSAGASAINNDGTAVGISNKYVAGVSKGTRAVRWDASGIAATELDSLSQNSDGVTDAGALAVNAGGMAVGNAARYTGDTLLTGTRPVRWDAAGAVTELGHLGLISGSTNGVALAINDAGTAVGWVEKPGMAYTAGKRAVRWNASGTIATELGNLGLNTTQSIFSRTDNIAFAVNAAGTAVGWAEKWAPNGKVWFGNRAVRWDASGTAATELGTLGLSGTNPPQSSGIAYAVNDAGTAAGYSQKYVGGILKGTRAVRWDWDAPLAAATELGNLGLDGSGSTTACAYALNGAGTAVGYSQKYVGGDDKGSRAVIWLQDAIAIDLTELGVAPVADSGTWTLTTAKALSADGWVAGSGTFVPEGAQAGYVRHWVTQVGLGGTWTNATDGIWGRGPNWSTGTPAMQVGNATFDLDAAYAVALDRDERTKAIAVDAGTVTINSNGYTLTAESGLSIAAGATLEADGTIVGAIVNAGTLAPGASVGMLSVGTETVHGSVTMAADSIYEWEFDGTNGDTVAIEGDLKFTGSWTLKLVDLGGGAPAAGQYNLFTFTGSVSDFLPGDIDHEGVDWDMEGAEIILGEGRVYMNIPEPATLGLLAFGALAALRRRS
jgi:hypothetical protein